MKKLGFVIALLFSPPLLAAEDCNTLESLHWLLGNWESVGGNTRWVETWEQMTDKTIEGSTVQHRRSDDVVTSEETLRLVEMSGEVFYIAKVAQNELPIAFKLTACGPGIATFENAQHDFPKLLRYELKSDATLDVLVADENADGFTIVFARRE